MTAWPKDEIVLAFYREFSVHGAVSSHMSLDQRREVYRIGILKNGRAKLPFFDSGTTYEAAYRLAFGGLLELRGGHRQVPVVDDEADDDEIDEGRLFK